jgi:hypothetical protein
VQLTKPVQLFVDIAGRNWLDCAERRRAVFKRGSSQHPLQHRIAGVELRATDELVRFVPLIHAARPADHGGYARRVEQPALGAERHGAERPEPQNAAISSAASLCASVARPGYADSSLKRIALCALTARMRGSTCCSA